MPKTIATEGPQHNKISTLYVLRRRLYSAGCAGADAFSMPIGRSLNVTLQCQRKKTRKVFTPIRPHMTSNRSQGALCFPHLVTHNCRSFKEELAAHLPLPWQCSKFIQLVQWISERAIEAAEAWVIFLGGNCGDLVSNTRFWPFGMQLRKCKRGRGIARNARGGGGGGLVGGVVG